MTDDLDNAIELMEAVLSDSGVPRNIRKAVEDAKNKIECNREKKEEISTAISSAIYTMDDISNDINMPAHARTEIWSIISMLESVREKNKAD